MRARPRYRLAELVARMTPENRRGEILTGYAVGREFPNGEPDSDPPHEGLTEEAST